MATIYPTGHGGSGATSTDCTATNANVLETKTAITSNSNDSPAQGTLPLAAVRLSAGGSLQINGVDSFSTTQSLTTPNTVVFNFTVTAKTGQPWGGLYIRYRTDRFPNSITDGTECGYYSLSGSTYTFSAVEATTTYYFRAWNFFRYNETVTDPQTYPLIEYGTYVSHSCTIYSHPVPYVLSYGGNLNNDVSGSVVVPAGYTNLKAAVIGAGGFSGASSDYYYMGYSGYPEHEEWGGQAGGEGGEVKLIDVSCTSGQTVSWTIGKNGTGGSPTYHENPTTYSYGAYFRDPYSQGTVGNNTSLTFNGTTTTSRAGSNGYTEHYNTWKAGGSGRGGAAGGAGINQRGTAGGSGATGTYFAPTGIYYGGGGCGGSQRYLNETTSSRTFYECIQGTKGATDGAYGHGGNGSYGYTANAGVVGGVVLAFY